MALKTLRFERAASYREKMAMAIEAREAEAACPHYSAERLFSTFANTTATKPSAASAEIAKYTA